ESDESLLATALRQAGVPLTFAELAEAGTVEPQPEPYVQFPDCRFPTPSGKIEIASAAAEREGLPRLPFPHADSRPAPGRLRVLSPAGPYRMNSEYGNAPALLARAGLDEVRLHPREAARRSLSDGGEVELRNEAGHLALRVRLDPAVPEGTALVHKGRWPKLSANRANINALFTGKKSDMGESTTVHSVEAELRAVGT
ncbi:MAG TPA: molybdopterin dinucleotide binding domain-containing protein, partial [Chthoniobacterales bacterium]